MLCFDYTFNPDGEPLANPSTIAQPVVSSSRVRLILTDNGVLAGWMETDPDGPSHQHQRIVLLPLDTNGQIIGPAVRLAERYAYRDSWWSLARVGDQVPAAFVEPLEGDSYGDRSAVVIQPLTFQGQPDDPAVIFSEERFARNVLIRTTPSAPSWSTAPIPVNSPISFTPAPFYATTGPAIPNVSSSPSAPRVPRVGRLDRADWPRP